LFPSVCASFSSVGNNACASAHVKFPITLRITIFLDDKAFDISARHGERTDRKFAYLTKSDKTVINIITQVRARSSADESFWL
jgi:hypothetical protein